MSQVAQEFLRYAIKIGALEFFPQGHKLKSGRLSPYFFNSGKYSSGRSLSSLASHYLRVINRLIDAEIVNFNTVKESVLFGLAYKGIPLATATAVLAAQDTYFGQIGYAFNRKEAKDHGDRGVVVGASVAGRKVILVDDVITDGASKVEGVQFIRQQGGEVIACLIAFDREERGMSGTLSATQAFTDETGVPVFPIARLCDLIALLKVGDVPLTDTEIKTMDGLLLAYHAKYGVK